MENIDNFQHKKDMRSQKILILKKSLLELIKKNSDIYIYISGLARH